MGADGPWRSVSAAPLVASVGQWTPNLSWGVEVLGAFQLISLPDGLGKLTGGFDGFPDHPATFAGLSKYQEVGCQSHQAEQWSLVTNLPLSMS